MKFAKLSVCLLLVLAVILCALPSLGAEADMTYEFSTLLPGRADGAITVKGIDPAAEYLLQWADDAGPLPGYDPLSGKVDMTVNGTTLKFTPADMTAIPAGATRLILTLDGTTVSSCSIPEDRRVAAKAPRYTFGVVSDLHFGSSNAVQGFTSALDYLENAGVSFVLTAGDNTCGGAAAEWNLLAQTYAEYDAVPLWFTLGNHDALAWNLSVTPDVAMKNLKRAFPYFGTETHPYGDDFKMTLSSQNPDYDYSVAYQGDLYLFMGIGAASNDSEDKNIDQRLSDTQLEWLEEELTSYYGGENPGNAFLIFHYYTLEGGMKVREGTEWNKESSKKLHALLNKFPGLIYFNGHNHHTFDAEPISYGGVYASLHVPSLAYGGVLNGEGHTNGCEGYLVEVYDDCVLVTGVDFTNGTFYSCATFRMDDGFGDMVKAYGMTLKTTASGAVQWRANGGAASWEKLTVLSDLKTDGSVTEIPYSDEISVEFRANETHMQWKLSTGDDSAWKNLIELEDIPENSDQDPSTDSGASTDGTGSSSGGNGVLWIAVAAAAGIVAAGAVSVAVILKKRK